MDQYTFRFDIHKKEVVTDCKMFPTDVRSPGWLYARNDKYAGESLDSEKMGKWMLFLPKKSVNAAWDKIKQAVENGELWNVKVSTKKSEDSSYSNSHVIIIYTKDYTDRDDVIKVHEYLENSGIKPPNVNMYYKTNEQTYAGTYSGSSERPWIYSSYTIRPLGSTQSTADSAHCTYEFDIHKKELVNDCNLYPTKTSKSDIPWLIAKNNKYTYEGTDGVNPENVGKWMLFLSKDLADAAWDKIKAAVASGELWSARVSTTNPENSPHGDSYAFMIYTKDYTDLSDVAQVHDFLESSGIKPPSVTMYYKTDLQTRAAVYSGGKQRSWIYSSYTIHELNK